MRVWIILDYRVRLKRKINSQNNYKKKSPKELGLN